MRSDTMLRLCTAAAVALSLAACVGSETAIDLRGTPELGLLPAIVESPANGSALPVNRIRADATLVEDQSAIGETVQDVDPSAAEWAIDLQLDATGPNTVVVTVYLIHVLADGTELVQFSGRTGPIVVGGTAALTPDVPIVRGPLANLSTTSVAITAAPTSLLIGTTTFLAAQATTSDGSQPTVYWTALDAGILSLAGDTATAIGVGTARVVATSGAFADTVSVEVLDVDSIAPSVVGTVPAASATGVARNVTVSATFDEDIDAASITSGVFVLRDSLGADVPATVSVSGPVVSLTPDTPLDSAHVYTATLLPTATDLAGNPLATAVEWSFTTGGQAVLLGQFDPGLGLLVAIAYDDASRNLYLHDDFSDTIRVYDQAGNAVGPLLPRPGASSNDIDLDFATTGTSLGSTQVPSGSLLVHNGEANPGTLFALDPATGAVLDSLVVATGGNVVGGAFHPQRGTFFAVSWNTDQISEIELQTGAILNSFPVAPVGSTAYDVFYGDVEVDPLSGNLLLVSSNEGRLRVLTADGAWVQDYDLASIGVSSPSGIAWDAGTRTAWISATTGLVFRVGGIN